jgi:hypothetical protein
MIKLVYLILLFAIGVYQIDQVISQTGVPQPSTNNTLCGNGIKKGSFCCDKSCGSNCGKCLDESSKINIYINTLCCPQNLYAYNNSCNYTMPPCIIFNNRTKFTNGTKTHNDKPTLPLWAIIVIILGVATFFALIFVCRFYPRERGPPLDYFEIIDKTR